MRYCIVMTRDDKTGNYMTINDTDQAFHTLDFQEDLIDMTWSKMTFHNRTWDDMTLHVMGCHRRKWHVSSLSHLDMA